jgi:hypothetical protein
MIGVPEMALKMRLVHGDVLDSRRRCCAVNIDDLVDKQERVTVRNNR